MKLRYILILPLLALIASACSGHSEKVESDAQIEAAVNAGREAARKIITRQFADSMEFHGAILDANAERSKLELDSLPHCAAAYDSAFISTIRTVRPDLADKLQ